VVGWKDAMESEESSAHMQGFSGEAIEEMGGGGQSISPVDGGHGYLK
jgi:hypothetical protein